VLIGFGSDLPPELAAVPFARSPVAIAVWGERADTLVGTCGTIDISCLVENAGTPWPQLGGSSEWGTLFLGLADPESGLGALEAWRLVEAANPGADFGSSVPLRGTDDGDLLANLVLFSSRADGVVASEVAIASQLENARARAGRLAVFYPDPTPFLSVVAYGEGRAARNLVDSLTGADMQAMLGSLGLRPITGEAINLLRDLGTPGAEMTGVSAAERTTLLESWNTLVGG
jgi:hypothetical protein